MKLSFYCASLAVACGSAQAADTPRIQKIVTSVDGEYLSFTDGFGNRRIVNGETRIDAGKTRAVLALSSGTRKTEESKFKATRVAASVVHDWTSRLSTRTAASIASNAPVFLTRELQQEVSYKPFAQTVVTVGGRYARYWGGVDVMSYSAGASQYFGGGMLGYRFTTYDVKGVGRTSGHLVSAKLDDGLGSNQLWLGRGSSLQDSNWLSPNVKGNVTSVEYRRVQPISSQISVTAGVNHTRYDATHSRHQGTGVRVGLVFTK